MSPPLEFLRRRKYVGFEVDIIREVANVLGRELIFVEASSEKLSKMLASGECDLVMGGYVQGAEAINSTIPYFSSDLAILIDTLCRPLITSLADLKGGVIGIIEGIGVEPWMEGYRDVRSYRADQMIDAMADLTTGKIDALCHLHLVATYLKYATPTVKLLDRLPSSTRPLVFGVSKELEETVNQTLSELNIQPIAKRWFGQTIESESIDSKKVIDQI